MFFCPWKWLLLPSHQFTKLYNLFCFFLILSFCSHQCIQTQHFGSPPAVQFILPSCLFHSNLLFSVYDQNYLSYRPLTFLLNSPSVIYLVFILSLFFTPSSKVICFKWLHFYISDTPNSFILTMKSAEVHPYTHIVY